MGLNDAKRVLVAALERGNFQHEARATIAEKNLLAIGDVTEEDVIRMIPRTRGEQYTTSPHDFDAETTVHVFKPDVDGVRWYVKAYLLDPELGPVVFISVHA